MRKQDHLLQLIASLSPNEKRYFKLFSNLQPGEKRYLQLFEALEDKTEYDSTALSIELGISTKQLADEKYYLSQVLLQNLRNLDGESNPISNLYNSLVEARALFNRRLYDYALEHTEKILSRAYNLELTYFIPDVISVKQSCLRQLSKFDELAKLDKANEQAVQQHVELFELMQLSFAVTADEETRELTPQTKKLFNHPLLKKKPGDLKSIRAFITWFNLKSRQHILFKGDPNNWLKLVKASIKKGEESTSIYEINPYGFLNMYTDLATAEALVGNTDEALQVVDRLLHKLGNRPKLVSREMVESLKVFALYLKVYFLRHAHRYNEAVAIAEKVYSQKHLRPVYDQFSFTLEYALCLFHTGQVSKAIDKLEELLQMNTDVRGDYQQLVRIILIVAQLDVGNFALVPYLVKSSKAWMKRKKFPSGEAEVFFSLTYAIAKAPETQRRQKWMKLKEAISCGQMEEIDKELNLKGWIERKLAR